MHLLTVEGNNGGSGAISHHADDVPSVRVTKLGHLGCTVLLKGHARLRVSPGLGPDQDEACSYQPLLLEPLCTAIDARRPHGKGAQHRDESGCAPEAPFLQQAPGCQVPECVQRHETRDRPYGAAERFN